MDHLSISEMQPAIYSTSEAADCYYSVSEMAIAIGSTSRNGQRYL